MAIEGDNLLVITKGGEEHRVITDGDTRLRTPAVADPGLDDLEVGDRVGVLVVRTEAGTLTAKVVVVRRGGSSFVGEIMVPIEATSTLLRSLLR